jgi:glycosyltransferase involved in cell wall biosynthesis
MRFFQRALFFLPIGIKQHLRTISGGPIIPGLARAIQDQQFDILAASSFPLKHMYISLRSAHQKNRPCVFFGGLHPLDEWGFQRPMIYSAIRQADRYIAYTQYEADYVIHRGAIPEKVTTIGLGVDLSPFERINPFEARQRLGISPDTPVVGFIGQLGGHKGVNTLIQAMSCVWEVLPHTVLLIAGAKTRMAEELVAQINQLPDHERSHIITIYNFASEEKPWLFAALDVFAYPSGFESFGIAFLEAWACSKPVIGCKSGAVPWVVNCGRDGLLVEFRNDKMLAEAILALLGNPVWARSLGEAGFNKVKSNYTWPKVAQKVREAYTQALR